MVVAQFLERSLPTPCYTSATGLKQSLATFSGHLFTVNHLWKRRKRDREWPIKNITKYQGCHGPGDLYAGTILPQQVRIPSTTSTLGFIMKSIRFYSIIELQKLTCGGNEKDENKQKRPGYS